MRVWKQAAQPLDQFDIILIEDSLQADSLIYLPYAQQGRTKKDYRVGSHLLQVYSR
jgi:hypothetical protein